MVKNPQPIKKVGIKYRENPDFSFAVPIPIPPPYGIMGASPDIEYRINALSCK
jgi:hypothetical protein